jgi:hypothetical protein
MTKREWLSYLVAAKEASLTGDVSVAFGKGLKNVHVRLWPHAVVYLAPPKSLHGKY